MNIGDKRSLMHWSDLSGLAVSGLRIVPTMLGAWLAIMVGQRGIHLLRLKISACLDDPDATKRTFDDDGIEILFTQRRLHGAVAGAAIVSQE